MRGFFGKLPGATTAPTSADRPEGLDIRKVVGNGKRALPVPGMVSVSYVQIGDTELPADFVHTAMIDTKNRRSEVQDTYGLVNLSDGDYLVRNDRSNFGVWQEGVDIFVGGEWSDPADASAQGSRPTLMGTTDLSALAAEVDAGVAAAKAADAAKAAEAANAGEAPAAPQKLAKG